MKQLEKIAVDLDDTLCYSGKPYRYRLPITENIALVNKLYDKYTIVIYTSRRKSDRKLTLKWLKLMGVKYHKLITGKLRATHYIDDKNTKLEDLL